MFEDVLKVRPNVKQEIKDLLIGQVEKAFQQKIGEEHDEEALRAMYKFKEAIDSKIDDFVKLYTEIFTTDEMIAMLDWAKSDLGIRADEFNANYIIPQCLDMLQVVIDEMVEEDIVRDEKYFDEIEARIENQTRLQKERMDEDEWDADLPDLKDFDMGLAKTNKGGVPG